MPVTASVDGRGSVRPQGIVFDASLQVVSLAKSDRVDPHRDAPASNSPDLSNLLRRLACRGRASHHWRSWLPGAVFDWTRACPIRRRRACISGRPLRRPAPDATAARPRRPAKRKTLPRRPNGSCSVQPAVIGQGGVDSPCGFASGRGSATGCSSARAATCSRGRARSSGSASIRRSPPTPRRSSSLEVSDGLFCWTHRHNGQQPASLQRVDVRRVRSRLHRTQGARRRRRGLLPRRAPANAVRLMRHWFRFSNGDPGRSRWPAGVARGGKLVHGLSADRAALAQGARLKRKEASRAVRPERRDSLAACGSSIGRNDLIPRRIEWLAIPGPRPVADGPLEPIAVTNFHDVEINGPVDATAFFYQARHHGADRRHRDDV
jgi:hypothetical protein